MYCVVIQEKGQPTSQTDLVVSGICVHVSEGERQAGRSTDRMTIHTREQVSIASLTCFPKHNLTACPLELRLPLQEKTKQT